MLISKRFLSLSLTAALLQLMSATTQAMSSSTLDAPTTTAINACSTSNCPIRQTAPTTNTTQVTQVVVSKEPEEKDCIQIITPGAYANTFDGKESKAGTPETKQAALVTAFEADTKAMVRIVCNEASQSLITQSADGTIKFWSWEHLVQNGSNKGEYLTLYNIVSNPEHNQWICVDRFGTTRSSTLLLTNGNNNLTYYYPKDGVIDHVDNRQLQGNTCAIFQLPNYLIIGTCSGSCAIYDKSTLHCIDTINTNCDGHFMALGPTTIGFYLPTHRYLKTYDIRPHNDQPTTIHVAETNCGKYPLWEKSAALNDMKVAFSCTLQQPVITGSNQQVAQTSAAQLIYVVDWSSEYTVAQKLVAGSSISTMACHYDGRLVFNTVDDQTSRLYIWNYWHNYLYTVDEHTDGVIATCLTSTPNHHLIVGYSDGSVRIFYTDRLH